MSDYQEYLTILPDGGIRQRSPLTGLEIWTIPGRLFTHTADSAHTASRHVEKKEPEDYCNLCEARYFNTPPEKERIVKQGSNYISLLNVQARDLSASKPLFRRIPNLFEIVTFEFWQNKYGSSVSSEYKRRKEEYLSDNKGRSHVFNVINHKLKRLGKEPSQINDNDKLSMADAFFSGGHEMIVAGNHFAQNSWPEPKLYNSGNMTSDEHFQFFRITISGIESCWQSNPHVKFVAVFQNRLKPAGASFDHLHKQIVAMDEFGPNINRLLKLTIENPRIFNQMGPEMAEKLHLVIAENDYALAFADIGHIHPAVTVQFKKEDANPCRLSDNELRGMSDLVHAVHQAIGNTVPCNEEWYYTPIGSDAMMPWRVCIKLRVNTSAGFEKITGIYISPIDPLTLRDHLVRQLHEAKKKGTIAERILLCET